MHWCDHHTTPSGPNLCLLDTITTTIVLFITSITLAIQFNRSKHLLRQFHRQSSISPSSTTTSTLLPFLSSLLLLSSTLLPLLHLLSLFFLYHTSSGPPPFSIYYSLVLAILWCSAALLLSWLSKALPSSSSSSSLSSSPVLVLHIRLFIYPVLVMYALVLYTEMTFFHYAPGSFSPIQMRVGFAVIMCCLALVFTIAYEWSKRIIWRMMISSGSSEDGGMYQWLLGEYTNNNNSSDVEQQQEEEGGRKKRKRSWPTLLAIAAKYLWPKESLYLQIRASFCIVLVIILRLLNIAVPFFYKRVIDTFSDAAAGTGKPIPSFHNLFYPYVAAYLVAYFFQGGSGGGVGLISNMRSFLWIPISQSSYRRATLDVFEHALGMDLEFHLKRKTGELLRIMDRGTNSIQTMLTTIVFNIGPAIFDIIASSVYIAIGLQPWIAVVVFFTLGTYIPMTIALTEWRGKFRRELNQLDNAKSARATDALLNYETVKLFNNEQLERQQFALAIQQYQVMEYTLWSSMNLLNIAQSFIIFSGMAGGIIVCTRGVANGTLTVGDTVLFVALMQQLYAPLNYFGSYYRMIQQSVLDMESMFDLLATEPSLKDDPHANSLVISSNGNGNGNNGGGSGRVGDGTLLNTTTGDGSLSPHPPSSSLLLNSVEFNNVWFSYRDNTPVLKGTSFLIPSGTTTALVGSTGAGKSTILRLLFRFYDPTSGSVMIGGQDISKVTQSSLRRALGVVPQDTVLFNDTIRSNIRYGRPGATDEEVEEVAREACIHDTIVDRFPLRYDTIVGERGLRLSGGEKQRVAFARALLKNPPILILDEATSALDSLTEKKIQEALGRKRRDRTVVIVAHRLSTVMDADEIVVLREGVVAERGRHEELLLLREKEGLYAEMWNKQREVGGGGGDGGNGVEE